MLDPLANATKKQNNNNNNWLAWLVIFYLTFYYTLSLLSIPFYESILNSFWLLKTKNKQNKQNLFLHYNRLYHLKHSFQISLLLIIRKKDHVRWTKGEIGKRCGAAAEEHREWGEEGKRRGGEGWGVRLAEKLRGLRGIRLNNIINAWSMKSSNSEWGEPSGKPRAEI